MVAGSSRTQTLDSVASGGLHAACWFVSGGALLAGAISQGRGDPLPAQLGLWATWTVFGTAVSLLLAAAGSRLGVLTWSFGGQCVAGAAAIAAGGTAFAAAITLLVGAPPSDQLGLLVFALVTLAFWTPCSFLVGQLRRLRRSEERALRLRAEASETELQAIRQQVSSHLVFNALNSILAAIDEDSDRASAMVHDLSRLLRQSLEALPAMGTLGDEAQRLELYARIERSRFEDDLSVRLEIPEGLRALPCLPMVLQPLVENAIKHGASRAGSALLVDVHAQLEGDRLSVRVCNGGRLDAAEDGTQSPSSGFGLRTIRHRLEREYGSAASLDLREMEIDGRDGVIATIVWPIR